LHYTTYFYSLSLLNNFLRMSLATSFSWSSSCTLFCRKNACLSFLNKQFLSFVVKICKLLSVHIFICIHMHYIVHLHSTTCEYAIFTFLIGHRSCWDMVFP